MRRSMLAIHTEETAAAYGLAVEVAKPSLHQIEPTGAGRNETRHKAGMAPQPLPDFLLFALHLSWLLRGVSPRGLPALEPRG
jgi:hypothetical protein